jgi:hypothetical protein
LTYPAVGCNPSQLPPIDVNERDQSPVSAEAGNMNPCSKTVPIRDQRSNCSSCVPDDMNGRVRVNVDPVSYQATKLFTTLRTCTHIFS